MWTTLRGLLESSGPGGAIGIHDDDGPGHVAMRTATDRFVDVVLAFVGRLTDDAAQTHR